MFRYAAMKDPCKPPRLTLGELKKQGGLIYVQCRSVGCYHQSNIDPKTINYPEDVIIERLPFRCSKCRKMIVMWGRVWK